MVSVTVKNTSKVNSNSRIPLVYNRDVVLLGQDTAMKPKLGLALHVTVLYEHRERNFAIMASSLRTSLLSEEGKNLERFKFFCIYHARSLSYLNNP